MKKVNNWEISLNNDKTELIFNNNSTVTVAYAYYDMKKDILYFDRMVVPKYVQNKAKKFAKVNKMIDIYN